MKFLFSKITGMAQIISICILLSATFWASQLPSYCLLCALLFSLMPFTPITLCDQISVCNQAVTLSSSCIVVTLSLLIAILSTSLIRVT